MTNDKPAPREWIANDGGSGFQAVGVIVKGPEFTGHIVLVEASALTALQEKNAALKAQLEKVKEFIK